MHNQHNQKSCKVLLHSISVYFIFFVSASFSAPQSSVHPSIHPFNCHLYLTANYAETHFCILCEVAYRTISMQCLCHRYTHTYIMQYVHISIIYQGDRKMEKRMSNRRIIVFGSLSVHQLFLSGQKSEKKERNKY